MDTLYIFCTLTTIVSSASVERSLATVVMYTDLLYIISDSGNCSGSPSTSLLQPNMSPWQPNTTRTERNFEDVVVVLSKFPFLKQNTTLQDGSPTKCLQEEVTLHNFLNYDWSCVSTGNGSDALQDSDWLFLNCTTEMFISTVCLSRDVMYEVRGQMCENEVSEETCRQFRSLKDGKHYMCSRTFRIERKLKNAHQNLSWSMSPLDLAACLCGSFIVLAFLLAVCVPDRACKPNYQSENELGLRVPLEIYEMYGVKYRPSAKKKLTRTTDGWVRRMSRRLMPHSRNLAIVASLDDLTKRNTLNATRGRDSIPVVIVDDVVDVTSHGYHITQRDGVTCKVDTSEVRGRSLDLGNVPDFGNAHVNDSFVGDLGESVRVELKNSLRSATSEMSIDYSVTSNKTEESVIPSEERRHSVC